jgi:crotonobetainyl-CoA:carnitine CoA-transferase CaiB-like acyl-CoA transferase
MADKRLFSDESNGDGERPKALSDLKVVDAAVLFAGPMLATYLGDFGAEVIKIEHPDGDPLRSLGWTKDGRSLWWAFTSRNKRCVSIKLSTEPGAALLKELVADADVFIESFRPGTIERWGLGPDVLRELNPGLIVVRTSGFGQTGPYRSRPGFGTVAESISGYAHINGYPDGPPTLPPFALGDGVCGLYGALGTLVALHHRERTGEGQVLDLSIYEPLFSLLGPQPIVYDQLGIVQERTGNSTDWTAPRNAYQTSDERWVGLSASSQSIAERVMQIVGHPELVEEDWYRDHSGRVEHKEELDEVIGAWMKEHTLEEVLAAFEQFEAALGPVYSIADIFEDPHFAARESIVTVEDEHLGPVRVQNPTPRFSETPGKVRHLGRDLGSDNLSVLVEELGHSEDELDKWRREGVI